MKNEYTLIDELRSLMLRLGASLVTQIDIWILAGGDPGSDMTEARRDAWRIAFDTAMESCRPENEEHQKPADLTVESEETIMDKVSADASGMLSDLGITGKPPKAITTDGEWNTALEAAPYAALGLCHVLLGAMKTYNSLIRLIGQQPFAPLDSETPVLIYEVAFRASVEDWRLRGRPVSDERLGDIEETLELLGLIPHTSGR